MRRRVRFLPLAINFLLFATVVLAGAQEKVRQDAKNSVCSNVVAEHGSVTLKCSGLTRSQSQDLSLILNTIIQNKISTATVLQNLKQIQAGVSKIQGQLDVDQQIRLEAEQVRRTPPQVDAYLSSAGDGKVRFYIKSYNLIPFEYREVIVTTNNTIVSSIPMAMSPLYPKVGKDLFYQDEDLHLDQIKNGYIELRFRYEALSFQELQAPELKGEVIRRYKIYDSGSRLEEITSAP